MYKLIAIAGKSGSGKNHLLNSFFKRVKKEGKANDYNKVIGFTTRPKRKNEKDGEDYHFISVEDFTTKALSLNELVEMTTFNDWFYGTWYENLDKEKINVGVFNLDGIEAIIHNPDIKCKVILLNVNDKERLLRQLRREEEPNVKEIIRRFLADEKDFYDISFLEERTEFFIWKNENIEQLRKNIKKLIDMGNFK